MSQEIDLLLINSIATRQRSLSDTALENSLVIIKQHLQDQGFNIKILDYQRINMIEKGIPKFLLHLIRSFVRIQVFSHQRYRFLFLFTFFLTCPLQSMSNILKNNHVDRLIKQITEEIKTNKIKLIGIKVWYGESYQWSKKLAASISKFAPETIIIAGGPQVNVYEEKTLENNCFDLVISGPAEKALAELIIFCKNLNSKKEILKRVINRNNNSRFIKCDAHSFINTNGHLTTTIPNYQTEDMQGKIKLHTVVDGVGCRWSNCNFCSHPFIYPKYFPRDINEIIQEFKEMTTKGIKYFRFSCSDTPLSHGRKIAQGIIDNSLNVSFSMFARPSINSKRDYSFYQVLIKAGLKAIFMGAETGHDSINRLVMNKGIEKQQIIDSVKTIRKAAEDNGTYCYIVLSLIYPCPTIEGVSLSDIYNENITLIQATRPDSVIVSPPSPFPNTKWFNNKKDFGFEFDSNFISNLMNYEYTHFKPTEIWSLLSLSLNGMDLKGILNETGKLRNHITNLGIPTDFSDEYFLMAIALGYNTAEDFYKFKKESLIDIMSGTTKYTKKIFHAFN